MKFFEDYQRINNLLSEKKENDARTELIKLLDLHQKNQEPYNHILNHLIRQVGLYPYIKAEHAAWQERFIYESFKADIGNKQKITLHREQSSVLKKLIAGKSLAVSAPTSFGKSFIIDAYIALMKPTIVFIIVPTIALSDETRRRLQKKFSKDYKIITTSDESVSEKNIFIFPQERAASYIDKVDSIDLLVIDEFYKASSEFDKERSSSLQSAIFKLERKSKQKYFLAPNITNIKDNIFTRNMDIVHVDFNTVFLEKHELYNQTNGDEAKKSDLLLDILRAESGKTLIYAGTYSAIDSISQLLVANTKKSTSKILNDFSEWLNQNYSQNWYLSNLIKRKTGIHTGQMHRSLSQIQIKLFEEPSGLKNIISTSSIIEGVNTSAENVVIWKNKNGVAKLNDFTYRNIIGRSGRMFKHFIGKVYILEKPPKAEETQLSLDISDDVLLDFDINTNHDSLTNEQIAKIISLNQEMDEIFGKGEFKKLQESNLFESSNSFLLKSIASSINENPHQWNGMAFLNSPFPEDWGNILYKFLVLQPGAWGIEYSKLISFIKILSSNWTQTIPELLDELDDHDIGIDMFFKLERIVSFKLSSLIKDANLIHQKLNNERIDISPFYSKLSNAFLPPLVYSLEEYGLPRMLSRKIHDEGIVDLECIDSTIHECISNFLKHEIKEKIYGIKSLLDFDKYILDHFYDGI